MTTRIELSEAESIEAGRRSDIAFPTAREIWRLRRRIGEVETELGGRSMYWNFRGAIALFVVGLMMQIGVGGWLLGWGALFAIGGVLWLVSTTQDHDRLAHERHVLEAQLNACRTTWDSVSGGVPFQSLLDLQFRGNIDPNCDGYKDWEFEVLTSISCRSVVGFIRKLDLRMQMQSDWEQSKSLRS